MYLKEEIWGCFKYIGIPIDIVQKMPIQDRRYFISRHNAYAEQMNSQASGNGLDFKPLT